MLLHLSYYQISCDTCGKTIYGIKKTQLKNKWLFQGGYCVKGSKYFCSKQCYELYNERLKNETNH